MSKEVIAVTKIEYSKPVSPEVKQSGEIQIEKPYQRETGEWAYPIYMIIDERRSEIYGDDSLQALNLSLAYIKARLEDYKTKGVKLYYPNSEDYFCIESCFGY